MSLETELILLVIQVDKSTCAAITHDVTRANKQRDSVSRILSSTPVKKHIHT